MHNSPMVSVNGPSCFTHCALVKAVFEALKSRENKRVVL